MRKRNFVIALSIIIFAGLSCSSIFLLADEACPEPNSHQVGEECYCDTYYKAEGGECVKMTESEICPTANSHQEGDQCVCDDGYGAVGNECVSKSAYCASHNAHFSAAINDCDCNEGYTINDAGDDCLPVPVETAANVNINLNLNVNANTPAPVNVNTEQKEASVIVDPVDVMISLSEDSDANFSVQPLIDVSLENATAEEIQTVADQKKSIDSMLSFNQDVVELLPTDEQKMDLSKQIITAQVKEDLNQWDIKVKAAETAGNVKDKNDKEKFEQIKREEESIKQQIKDNQEALGVMHKQNLAVMFSNEAFAPALSIEESQIPRRDFMKEANDDKSLAAVYATQAISAQYKLLRELKDNLKAKKEEKMKLLDIPAKPDLEKKLKDFEKKWYE